MDLEYGKGMKWSKQNIEAFLKQLNKPGFVPANCLPWYRRWFWMFVDRFPSGAYGLSQENLLSEFTRFLSKKRLLDFQLRQARHCVLLFLRSLDTTEKKRLEIRVAVSESPGMDKDILLDELVKVMKFEHKSPKTIKSYRFWVRRFLLWPPVKPQKTFGNGLIRRFLTYLAVELDVSASTQNQAFHALLYFYRHVLRQEAVDVAGTVRAKKRKTIPSVMSPGEVEKLLEQLDEPYRLMTKLMYGCGLRLNEVLNLRLKDVNHSCGHLAIQLGKGEKSRALPIPQSVAKDILTQKAEALSVHKKDMAVGCEGVFLPSALDRQCRELRKSPAWQWLFPAPKMTETAGCERRRNHVHDSVLQKRIKCAAQRLELTGKISPHTLRHSYATRMLEMGVDIRTVQEKMGHNDLRTTMIYTHIRSGSANSIVSPLDEILEKADFIKAEVI